MSIEYFVCVLFFSSDASFIAGIAGDTRTSPFHFDTPIWNPGQHFNASTGEYVVPYDGEYFNTVTINTKNLQRDCIKFKDTCYV